MMKSYLMKFQVSTLTSGNSATGHFSIMKKLWELKNDLSNLEEEGEGRGIIMGVTRLLLLGPFYTIQIQINVLFCTRLYISKSQILIHIVFCFIVDKRKGSWRFDQYGSLRIAFAEFALSRKKKIGQKMFQLSTYRWRKRTERMERTDISL